MKINISKKIMYLALLSGLVCFVISGCDLVSASVSNLQVGTEVDETSKEVINSQDTLDSRSPYLYASIFVKNAPEDTRLRATWTYKDRQIAKPSEIDVSGSRYIAFSSRRPIEGFRTGDYKITVEIIDSDEKIEKTFSVI
ncbi:hypothetical protein ACFL2B_01385 [Patescibacteria group bacterium]